MMEKKGYKLISNKVNDLFYHYYKHFLNIRGLKLLF